MKQSSAAALDEVDAILASYNGRRLADEPNALGYTAVETTPVGLLALAQSSHVRAILEDQPARSIR